MAHEQSFHSAVENDEHMEPEVKGAEDVLQESVHSETSKESKSGGNVAEGEEDLASNGSLLGKEEAGDDTIEFRNLGNESSFKTYDELCKTSTSNCMVTKEADNKSDFAIESGDFDALEASQRAEIAGEREAIDHEELHGGGSSPEAISRDFFSSESHDIVENNKQFHYILEEPNVVGSMTGMDISNSAFSPKNNDCNPSEGTTDPSEQNLSFESLKTAAILESSGKIENGKFDLDLNTKVDSEDLDCETSLNPFNPVNMSAPTIVSAKNGAPIIPLYFDCELGLRSYADTSSFHPASRSENIMSDSERSPNFAEIDLNMAIDPLLVKGLHAPYGTSSIERAEKIQLGLDWIKEEEEAPPLLQLSSSMRNFDLNDDPFVFDSDPILTILDSRMSIDKRDELSTRAFITRMEDSTPSCSNWVPDLNLNSGMMQIYNGSNEEGSQMHLFIPESRNLLGEERKAMKRKEPDSGLEPYGFDYDQLRLKL